MKTNNTHKNVEEIVEELVGGNCLPCCKVCQCQNGKKVWCACHRKQLTKTLSTLVEDTRREEFQRASKIATERMKGRFYSIIETQRENTERLEKTLAYFVEKLAGSEKGIVVFDSELVRDDIDIHSTRDKKLMTTEYRVFKRILKEEPNKDHD